MSRSNRSPASDAPTASTVTLGVLVVASLVFATWASVPAGALEAYQESTRGQVAVVTTAEIDGERFGLAVDIKRGAERMPDSTLHVIPDPNPANWTNVSLPRGPGSTTVGDVTGDGNDEVAITHNLEGEPCPYPVQQMPCGVVHVYDGSDLVEGNRTTIAEVEITPQEGHCQPTNYPPSALALRDVTGDGRADLALSQLGMMEGSCGVAHVIPAERLDGTAHLGDACARVHGPPVGAEETPNQFGAAIELVPGAEGEGPFLAVGAPYTTVDDMQVAGRATVYDIGQACPGDETGPERPQRTATYEGTSPGDILGSDFAFADGRFWLGSNGTLHGYTPPSFEESVTHRVHRGFPVSVTEDLTGDGTPELMVGSTAITTDNELVLNFAPLAEQSFRGTLRTSDHLITATGLGLKLWSMTDLRTPYLGIHASPNPVTLGETVNVSVAQLISFVPDPGTMRWDVSGGTIVEQSMGWVHVRPDAPGQLVVKADLGNASALARVPVDVGDAVRITGPDTVPARQPIRLNVHAPENATVEWAAPGGHPSSGTGSVETVYERPGTYTVHANATFSNGNSTQLEHEVRVLDASLAVVAPERVDQGQALDLAVEDPDPDLTYEWFLEGAGVGPTNLTGPSIRVTTAGWGTLNVTVASTTADGERVGVGHAQTEVANLPPEIEALNVRAEPSIDGIQAQARVQDPGGDPVRVGWFVDGNLTGTGTTLSAPDAGPGEVRLTVVAVDDDPNSSSRITRHVEVPGWETVEPSNDSAHDRTSQPVDENASNDTADERSTPAPGALALGSVLATLAVALRWRRRTAG